MFKKICRYCFAVLAKKPEVSLSNNPPNTWSGYSQHWTPKLWKSLIISHGKLPAARPCYLHTSSEPHANWSSYWRNININIKLEIIDCCQRRLFPCGTNERPCGFEKAGISLWSQLTVNAGSTVWSIFLKSRSLTVCRQGSPSKTSEPGIQAALTQT